MSRILVVEDEAVLRSEVVRSLQNAGHVVVDVDSLSKARNEELSGYDLIISDLRLPGGSGTELLRTSAEVPVLIMTSYATVKSAVEAMRQGAADYIAKPFEPEELEIAVERILQQRQLKRRAEGLERDVRQAWGIDRILGSCEAMQAVLRRVRLVSATDATVLILGESGTGKELVARAIHDASSRASGPFVAVNCAAIPDNLIESELFGHEKGAFTGAVQRHTGLVEAAHEGTLFLDEVGELPPSAQARLLRVLQEQEIRHVGSSKTRQVDVRVLAATHRDLPRMVDQGAFREDLYYRLKVVDIELPPLRQRGDDLLELAEYLLEKVCRKLGRSGLAFDDAAYSAMLGHRWPGNVRELENAIERGVILCEDRTVTAELLGLQPRLTAHDGERESGALDEYFRTFVLQHQSHLSETEIARRLGISRKALWERRRRFGLARPKRG